MGLAGIVEGARRQVSRFRRRRRAEALFGPSGLFDAAWYRRTYPDSAGWNPLDHFLEATAGGGAR